MTRLPLPRPYLLAALLGAVCLLGGIDGHTTRKTSLTPPAQQEKAPPQSQPFSSEELRLIHHYGFAPTQVGFLLQDPVRGEAVRHHQQEVAFIPASVSKIPTTVAALAILGAEHRFTTTLRTTGPLTDGVLHGDLYLVGGGDPTLSFGDLMNLALQLHHQGVQRLEGAFYYDESYLISEDSINNEQNDDENYNQGVSALSVDFNRVKMTWSLKGKHLTSTFTPDLGYVAMVLGARSGHGAPQLIFVGGEESEGWRLEPGGASNGEGWLPIKRPGRYTALMLRKFSQLNGLELPFPEPRVAPAEARLLYIHESPPLAGIVERALEFSNNLWTELIGIGAANHRRGSAHTMGEAGVTLSQWFKEQLPQVAWGGFRLDNSSGLTSQSRVTPQQMVEILQYADNRMPGGLGYLSLLPISAWKGTLSHRLGDAALRVWAKTGTMNYGRGLAGHLYSDSGRRFLFAVFVTDFAKRAAFDQLLRENPGRDMGGAEGWNGRAGDLIFALVEYWRKSR